jgi:hypothetical protein
MWIVTVADETIAPFDACQKVPQVSPTGRIQEIAQNLPRRTGAMNASKSDFQSLARE